MGKKGSWFSAIKRVFTHGSKERPSNGSDAKRGKEKKKGKGILRPGETKSLIPLFREPSSIEKILGEADQLFIRPPISSDQSKTSPALLQRPSSPTIISPNNASFRASSATANSPRVSSARLTSPRATSPRAVLLSTFTLAAAFPKTVSPQVNQSRKEISYVQRPEPTLRNQHISATKIQAAHRGYLARRNFRALRGLVRLQGVMRGQNVKRQTLNAMKQMQLLVRVQTQIQSRRIQMLESEAFQSQAYRNDKEIESTLSKWTMNQLSEAGNDEDWDDSMLTKEEIEARIRKKIEAVIKRERAMAYAYSHQLWKAHPKSAQSPIDVRSNGFPWWWNWLERQLPPASKKPVPTTPPWPVSEYKPSLRLSEAFRAKHFQTPSPGNTSGLNKFSKPRTSGANQAHDLPLRDDDSLTSCPPFSSVRNYMTPTVSTKAKVRSNSNPKERLPGTPSNDSKRRFSFSLTPNIGSFKWNKGSNKDSASQKILEKHLIGDLSVDSTVSMPAIVGRKPFNRFV